jgi:hypothetical protein
LETQQEYLDEVLAEVTDSVRCGYPLAQALILTGSAARNEATFLRRGPETLWLSDLEFLVVVPDSAAAAKEAAKVDGLAARIEQELRAKGTVVSIDLGLVRETRAANLPRNLFGYETRLHGKQLYGERDYLKEARLFSWREVPLEDAWRLLSNRMVEWLDFQSKRTSLSAAEQFYRLSKQYLDILTSLTLMAGCYTGRYETRVAAVEQIRIWLEERIPSLRTKTLIDGAFLAGEFKLHPEAPAFVWLQACKPESFSDGLAAKGWPWLERELPGLHAAVWDWELATLTGSVITSPADILGATGKLYRGRERFRGWGKLLLRPALWRDPAFLRRMTRLAPLGAPRGLVYSCARLLADSSQDGGRAVIETVRRCLPVVYPVGSETREDLVRQCVLNWKNYLRR